MSAALAVVLVLMQAPCCEAFAAVPPAAVPAEKDAIQCRHDDCGMGRHDDCGVPTASERCTTWLDQAFFPVDDALPPVSGSPGVDAPLPNAGISVQTACVTGAVPHAGAPPPARALYLFTSRLLL